MSSEVDYQILLGTYQQKSSELLSQTIALEARVRASNHQIDVLNKQVNDLIAELEKHKSIIADLKTAELNRLAEEKEKQRLLEEERAQDELHFGLVAAPEPKPKVARKKKINSAETNVATQPAEGEV